MGKKVIDQAIWKYTSVLLAQPFDVAKTILQVRLAAAGEVDGRLGEDMRRRPDNYRDDRYEDVGVPFSIA